MQSLQGTSLSILPASQSNHSTSNVGLPEQFGNRKPPIEHLQSEQSELPYLPFGQAPASDPPARVPYQSFLALVSFVASIVFSLGISAAQSLATSQSFFGSSLPNGGAMTDALFKASRIFAWAGALAAVGLVASLALQLLLTSPMMMRGMHHHKGLVAMVTCMAWFSVIVVCGSIVCVAEAIKVIDQKAGLAVQVHNIIYPQYVASNASPLIVVAAGCWAWATCGLDLGTPLTSTVPSYRNFFYGVETCRLELVFSLGCFPSLNGVILYLTPERCAEESKLELYRRKQELTVLTRLDGTGPMLRNIWISRFSLSRAVPKPPERRRKGEARPSI